MLGVAWRLAVLVLRYTEPEHRQWKVPGNLRIAGKEIPLGVIIIFLILFTTAIVNLFTKYEATISGVGFSVVLFFVFTYSERRTARERKGKWSNSTNSGFTATRNSVAEPWECGRGMFWLQCAIPVISTTCVIS